MTPYEAWQQFIDLFGGLDHVRRIGAFGTGRGQWIKRPLRPEDVVDHLAGRGVGIGVPPLDTNNTVMFAAIDLDEPDFDAAHEMATMLPGTAWIERSRSGNAHVWSFFREPLEAWVAMGIMKEATLAAGKSHVEVFPKNHDFAKVKFGNYINLPYHGQNRPIIHGSHHDGIVDWEEFDPTGRELECEWPLDVFLTDAYATRNDPEEWRKKAKWLLIAPPDQRERSTEFGGQENLHICADWVIEHAEDNPVLEGHRAAVYFSLAKMLTNWKHCDHDEALQFMRSVNEASPDRVPDSELRRILGNVERGEYTSTGCDDPLFAPYAHPDCRIANPRG